MPIRRGIVDLVEAIEDRIEVAGHAPTWRVTGGSFESALRFAREAYDDPVVISRTNRNRWWPRVTLTVTTDPELAADTPDLEVFARAVVPEQARGAHDDAPVEPDQAVPATWSSSALDSFFAGAEQAGAATRPGSTVAPVLLVVLASLAVALAVLSLLLWG